MSDTMWADSNKGRWMMNNRGNSDVPVSFWPCGSSNYGCIPYSGTLTNTIYTEAGLLYPSGQNFFLQAGTISGHNAPVWSVYTLPASLATTGGILYGSSSTVVSQSSAATLGGTGALNIVQGSLSSSTPAFNQTAIWSSVGTTFTNFLTNVTDSSSAAGSKLMDLQVTNVSKFSIDKAGNPTAVGQLTLGANLGAAGQVTFNGSNSGSATLTTNSTGTNLTSNQGFVAPKFTINSLGGHIQTSAPNSDTSGTITITASTSASMTFANAYGSAPVCVATPTASPGTHLWYITYPLGGSSFQINLTAGSATLTFNYICIGNAN